MKEYKYLSFIELNPKPKTKVFEVRNKQSGDVLGLVQWYGPWRKYCYFTFVSGLVFDADCLSDIQDFINTLMTERRRE